MIVEKQSQKMKQVDHHTLPPPGHTQRYAL